MVLKTYTTETPLNSAAIAPGKPYVRIALQAAWAHDLTGRDRCSLVVARTR